MNIYELDINKLTASAEKLDDSASKLLISAATLSNILSNILTDWQNYQGQDIESITLGLDDCIQRINTKIGPTLQQLSKALLELAEQTQQNQSRTMD